MNRRVFLQTSCFASASFAISNTVPLYARATSLPWRTFDVTTRVEVLKPAGSTRVWLPAALIRDTEFQKTISNHFSVENGKAAVVESKRDSLGIVSANFPPESKPILTLISRVAVRDFAVNLSAPKKARPISREERDYFLRATKFVPVDGLVKETALKATKGAVSDTDKARAIYEWVVENTFRDPKVRGCGRGDIRFLLESGDLGGKCADLNALYVGLARSIGLPARHVYGVRVAKSELGYKSLGAASENVTKAQHCRAEVYLNGHGWVPVDPADVRKVVLEEPPGNLALENPKVSSARTRLFGSWEMNWIAYNCAQDVALPGSTGDPITFLMYPQAETGEGRLDPLDPDNFKYEITAKEIV